MQHVVPEPQLGPKALSFPDHKTPVIADPALEHRSVGLQAIAHSGGHLFHLTLLSILLQNCLSSGHACIVLII